MSGVALNRRLAVALGLATLAVAGCGGGESRKAKHLEKGQQFLSAGNFEKARVEFRNALQIAPTDSEARYENGVVDEKLGNIREAAQFYRGAIDVDADNVQARVGLGRVYLFGGAPDKALELIDPVFAKHPDDAGLLTVRAAARVQLKDRVAALADAQRAVQLAPLSEDAVSVLAGIYKANGDTAKAIALLDDAVKRIPGAVDLRLELAQLYGEAGQEARSEEILVDLVRLNPAVPSHRFHLAQFYARMNKIDDAERVLREGIKAMPQQRDMKSALVDFLSARRSREVAETELSGFIAQDPKDYALRFALAQFYEQGKDFPKAEEVYRQVIAAADLDGPGITARDRLAALRARQNDAAGAEKLIAEVLAKVPRDDDALILRGNLALAQKDPKTAIADLRAVLRDQPNAIAVMRTLAREFLARAKKQGAIVPLMIGHRLMGNSLLFTGEIVEGRAHFDQALALYDHAQHRPLAMRFGQDVRVAILSFRSRALCVLGYPEAALADASHAIKDARGLDKYAKIYRELIEQR